MITLDGSMGEGGGQILRSALALSLVTQTPFVMQSIRAGRKTPGLMRQHLACVVAARAVGEAEVEGDHLGSEHLYFRPRALRGGEYHFAVGSAGSAMLVLQTVLVPLLHAKEPSRLLLEGGTHNPSAPPFDFLSRVFLPALARMGIDVELQLARHGFYPAGAGRVHASIAPWLQRKPLVLVQRGREHARRASALLSNLPEPIGVRELDALCAALAWDRRLSSVHNVPALGPGNALLAEVVFEEGAELITGFGAKRVAAECVASEVAEPMKRFLAADVPVGEHLADQLLLPMALGAGGSFRALALSLHATTQIELLRVFLGTEVRVLCEGPDACRVEVTAASG